MPDNTIQFASDLPSLPETLVLARDRGEVLFVVGAGVSMPAPSNLPSFRTLVVDVYRDLDSTVYSSISQIDGGADPDSVRVGLKPDQDAELKRFVDGDYDVTLGMLERRLDGNAHARSATRAKVEQRLSLASTPNPLHTAMVRLAQRFGETLIVTTNFDRLLEAAAKRARLPFRTFALGAMPWPSERPDFNGILHIHGVLSDGRDSTPGIILTDRDFGEAYLRRKFAAEFIYDAARIFSIVLVGYSANDAPMRYLLNAIAGDEIRFRDLKPRYALVGAIPSGDPRLAADWQGRGIQPIQYDESGGHAALPKLLTAWADSTPRPGRDVWSPGQLRRICAQPRRHVSDADRSLADYIIRRSTTVEQLSVIKDLASWGASADWLDAAHVIMRERRP